MISKSQFPTNNSSNPSYRSPENSKVAKTQVLNPNASQTGKWSTLKKTAAVLTSLSFIGFGAPRFIEAARRYLKPQPSNSYGFTVLLAIPFALGAYAYYTRGKTVTPKESLSAPVKSKRVSIQKIIQKPITIPSQSPLTSPKGSASPETGNTSSSTASSPIVSRQELEEVKTRTPEPVPTRSPLQPTKSADSPSGQKPQFDSFRLHKVNLRSSQRALKQQEKLELENKEKEERKQELGKLSRKELRINDEAWTMFDPIKHLEELENHPEYERIKWMKPFGGNTLINETKATELTKILLEKITACSNADFELYVKIEIFWIAITNPKLKNAAIEAISPKQMEILVSEVMSCEKDKRLPQLNLVLLTLTACENTDRKKNKLKEIAKCPYQELNVEKLELAAKQLKARKEIMDARKEAKAKFTEKCKEESRAYQEKLKQNSLL
jgi:hypothetical protein